MRKNLLLSGTLLVASVDSTGFVLGMVFAPVSGVTVDNVEDR